MVTETIREQIRFEVNFKNVFALRELLAEIQELCDRPEYSDVVVKFEER